MLRLLTLGTIAMTLAAGTPARAEVSCTTSRECVDREGHGTVCAAGACEPYLDRTDVPLALGFGSQEKATPKPYRLLPAIIPAIGYNPALGFLIGAVGNFGMYLGDPATTTISNLAALLLFTTEKQMVIQINGITMTSENEWELQSDWRYLVYNQDTYGLGTGTPPISGGVTINGWGTTAAVPGAQPMDFKYIRFHQLALRRVFGGLYVGGGYRYDRYYDIVDKGLDLAAEVPVVTSHYAYSKYYGYGTGAYTVSSLSLSALYDSRDSTINAYRGFYGNLDYRISPTWLGSSKASSLLFGEFRAYVPLSDDSPRNVLAFWVLAQGVVTGDMPYLALPSTAWDATSVTGRGFIQGRFRGPAEVYGEVEWRFRILNNGLLGGALFANAQTFSRPPVSITGYANAGEKLFDKIVPAGGAGLRVLLNRDSRTNLRVDVAVGQDQVAFYLGAGEVF
jgi:hypothetical protein